MKNAISLRLYCLPKLLKPEITSEPINLFKNILEKIPNENYYYMKNSFHLRMKIKNIVIHKNTFCHHLTICLQNSRRNDTNATK